MCEIIDCRMFDCIEARSINEDNEEQGQKIKIQSLLDENYYHFQFHHSSKNTYKKLTAYSLVSQIRDKLDVMIQIELENTSVTVKTKNIYISDLYIIRNRTNKISVAKQLIKTTFNNVPSFSRTKFSSQTGEILIQENCQLPKQNIKHQQKFLIGIIEKLIEKSVALFNLLQKLSKPKSDDNPVVQQRKTYPIIRYLIRSTVEPSFSVKSQCAQYGSLIQTYSASNCGLENLSKINISSFQATGNNLTTLNIYGLNFNVDNKFDYMSDIFLSEKQKIQSQIVIPSLSLLRSNENKFVFNQCYFYSNKYPQKKIQEGGNSQIFVMKVDLYEYSTTSYDKEKQFEKNPKIAQYITKHLIHKKSKDNDNLQNRNITNNHIHQTQIVSYLRGGTCQYLPKYYLNIEKATPYHNRLFIDYLSGDTLDNYLSSNSLTISTLTKIWLMLQVIQALRFISQFGVVHLDIKETNIIVMKKLICKLFDFGESYHSRVCGNDHKPKYSLLYGSPQVVINENGRGFTQKSDVYSFGIMMYHIFFEKYPYFFGNQKKFQRQNIDKNLRNKTFYVPQYFDQRGDHNIMEILSQLILKCMEMDEKKRPYLDWIGLILKFCLNYLVNQ